MVRARRLELPRGCPHMDLNHARLPFRHARAGLNYSTRQLDVSRCQQVFFSPSRDVHRETKTLAWPKPEECDSRAERLVEIQRLRPTFLIARKSYLISPLVASPLATASEAFSPKTESQTSNPSHPDPSPSRKPRIPAVRAPPRVANLGSRPRTPHGDPWPIPEAPPPPAPCRRSWR